MNTPKKETRSLTVLNCGIGRDSIAMLCLVVERKLEIDGAPIGPEDLDAVIFSDTGAEWTHTYEQLPKVRKLCEDNGIRFLVLAKPADAVWKANLRKKGDTAAPVWMRGPGWASIEAKAASGAYHRRLPILWEYMRFAKIAITQNASCTDNHKVLPIRRCINDLSVERFGITNRSWSYKVRWGSRPKHNVILGIAADEAHRAIETGRPHYERPVYPLVAMGITKADEAAILERHGFGDVKKSGCFMCPYQPIGWFWALRETQPEQWAETVAYEAKALAANPKMNVAHKKLALPEAVNAWRARNPDATIESVLAKSYERPCKTTPNRNQLALPLAA